ncbi:MAG: hypothetical protein RI894_156 [Bacteroidota bacterium]|jgi:hypothetical protein
MKNRFNITSLSFPNQHYMADVSLKIQKTYEMIEYGDYFIINRRVNMAKQRRYIRLRKNYAIQANMWF